MRFLFFLDLGTIPIQEGLEEAFDLRVLEWEGTLIDQVQDLIFCLFDLLAELWGIAIVFRVMGELPLV